MTVQPWELDQYNRMMASGGIVPGTIPPEKLAELQLATGSMVGPVATTGRVGVTKPLDPDRIIPGDPSTYPIVEAGLGALVPYAIGAGLALWDIFGGGIGGDPGGGVSPAPAGLPPLVGPGVPEPPGAIVKKRWETKVYDNELGYIKLNFYALVDGRIMMYHNTRKYWKIWRPKKSVVISSNPRLSHLKKLARLNKRVEKTGRKLFPAPKKTSVQAPSAYLSKAERKLLTAAGGG